MSVSRKPAGPEGTGGKAARPRAKKKKPPAEDDVEGALAAADALGDDGLVADEPPPARPKPKGRKGGKVAEPPAAPPRAPRPEPWVTSDAPEFFTPLSFVKAGDVIEVRGDCRGNERHFIVKVEAPSFTVRGQEGGYVEACFEQVVKGAGAAALAAMLTGPGGQGLLHFCEGAAADCPATTPDKGRELVHVDTYRLRPDLIREAPRGTATPPRSERGGRPQADPAGGAALFGPEADDLGGRGGRARGGTSRPDLDRELAELKRKIGASGGDPARGAGSVPHAGAVGETLAERALAHRERVAANPPEDDRKPRPGVRAVSADIAEREAGEKGDDESGFRQALPRAGDDLMTFSRRHPGQLLQLAVEEIDRYLSTRGRANVADGIPPEAKFVACLTTVVHARHPPDSLGDLNQELRTLAEVLDALILGDLPRVADLCAQRFKSCEVRARGGSKLLAAQHELVPRKSIGLAAHGEEMLVGQLELQQAKLSEIEEKAKGKEKSG